MCGIVGYAGRAPGNIDSMLAAVRHRGPDATGTVADEHVTLGHCRLAVIDLAARADQPFSYAHQGRRVVASFNGEIYNFREVRAQLERDYHFTTQSDTEVLCAAYLAQGVACLSLFRGMFSFALYDVQEKTLFCARDRFGIKPFYYTALEGGFAFCSTLNGLLPLLPERRIDALGLRQFFTFRYTLHDDTLVSGVKKLKPGHFLVYDLRSQTIRSVQRYYELPHVDPPRNRHVARQRLRELLEEVVNLHMVGDVPVGSLLSGGIDSAVVTALAARRNPDLHTFSIGFDTTNELAQARHVAQALGTKHHEFHLSRDTVLASLDDMMAHMDEPIGDPGFLPVYVLSREVRRYNKVVLSGDGADEIFVGYDRYKMLRYGPAASHFVPGSAKHELLRRVRQLRGRSGYTAFLEIIRLFSDDELLALGIAPYDASALWQQRLATDVQNGQLFDIDTVMPNDFFMKADKMSSAFGLELRVPYFDHVLVEFAMSLPLRYKLGLWKEKLVLREAVRDLLPDAVVARKKFGFNVPIDHWFREVLADLLQALLENSRHHLYDSALVREQLQAARKFSDRARLNFFAAQKLWSVLIFELWHQRFMA